MLLHPPLVPVTVYTVVETGDIDNEVEVCPPDQLYVMAPETLNNAELPLQTEEEEELIVNKGLGLTGCIKLADALQLPAAPVTE